MKFSEIIDKLKDYLPEHLKNNPSFVASIRYFKENTEDKIQFVEIAKSIYKVDQRFEEEENLTTSYNDSILINAYNEGDAYFSITCENFYTVHLYSTKEIDQGIYKSADVKIKFYPNLTNWVIAKSVLDEEDNYLEYDVDSLFYSKNHNLIKVEDVESIKDREFCETFGIPFENAREYRINFNGHKEFLNTSRKRMFLKETDKYADYDRKIFSAPFKINELNEFLINTNEDFEELSEEEMFFIDEDIEEYEEEFIEDCEEEFIEDEIPLEEQEARLNCVKDAIISITGTEGEFVMSQNICDNLEFYLEDKEGLIYTTGLIIKKISNDFTIYYTHINDEGVVIIPHTASKEEIHELYIGDELNEYIDGLSEFFNQDKNYRLEN